MASTTKGGQIMPKKQTASMYGIIRDCDMVKVNVGDVFDTSSCGKVTVSKVHEAGYFEIAFANGRISAYLWIKPVKGEIVRVGMR